MRKAVIVLTKSGKKGYVYHDENEEKTKVKVRLIDNLFQETGVNLLCDRNTLKLIGFKD